MSKVITRFAPSPTGELHIGGARTALFNWLYAKHTGGKFLLRIEDTDRDRSSDEYAQSIQDQLQWLGLDWDDDVVSQYNNRYRHIEVANQIVRMGKAYYCYASKDELDQLRKDQEAAKIPYRYDGRWRDKTSVDAPIDVSPVIRIKADQTGKTTIHDLVQGIVTVDNSALDDMIIVRADGTPTYMLAVVVDDYDAGVTHVIRGDDHLNNAFRQIQIIKAMGWNIPTYAHIPLIHGEDGKKLSKRNSAPSVNSYKDAGYLPDAVCNYILRMGWGHENDEIIPKKLAIDWFDIADVSKAASRLDSKKLLHINSVYMGDTDTASLIEMILPIIKTNIGAISADGLDRINRGFDEMLSRSRTITELANSCMFYAIDGLTDSMITDSVNYITTENYSHLVCIKQLFVNFDNSNTWNHKTIDAMIRTYSKDAGISFSTVASPLRRVLTGSPTSPSLFEVIYILGINETVKRLQIILDYNKKNKNLKNIDN